MFELENVRNGKIKDIEKKNAWYDGFITVQTLQTKKHCNRLNLTQDYYNIVVDRPNSTKNHSKSQWALECPWNELLF